MDSSDSESENGDDSSESPPAKVSKTATTASTSKDDLFSEEFRPVKIRQSDLGKVVCVCDEAGKTAEKRKWYPAMVVRSKKRIKSHEVSVRNFKDNKL